VRADGAAWPDWRDAQAYAPLLDADRSLIAWEWLRRDPRYRAAVKGNSSIHGPADFGLVAFEPPHLAVPHARPLWTANADPFVLAAERSRAMCPDDLFDLARMDGSSRIIADDAGEHLLLCDGVRAIRLDGPAGLFSEGAVGLRYMIGGLSAAEAPLSTLRRFLALCRTGRFSRDLHRAEQRARRWILMLRAWDGLVAGASQREIACMVFSRSATEARWRIREPSIRSRTQRLVRSARDFAQGGYRELLHPHFVAVRHRSKAAIAQEPCA
jgi:hypothetical protein